MSFYKLNRFFEPDAWQVLHFVLSKRLPWVTHDQQTAVYYSYQDSFLRPRPLFLPKGHSPESIGHSMRIIFCLLGLAFLTPSLRAQDRPDESANHPESTPESEVFHPVWPEASNLRQYTPYVQNITLISGNEETIPCPSGYGKLEVDLNHFAGGPYIFLCYGKSDSLRDSKGAIEGLTVETAVLENQLAWNEGCRKSKNGTCVSHYVRAIAPSNGDMNQGVGGDFIYLAKDLRPCLENACEPGVSQGRMRLREIAIVKGESVDVACPNLYTKIPIDLNQGSRGSKIFLCQMLRLETAFD